MYNNPNFIDCNRLSILDQPSSRPQVITIRPGPSSSLKEITVISGPRPTPRRPREITLISNNSFVKLPEEQDPLSCHPSEATTVAKKIPRPPNAFMIFANDWRKRLALQNPTESNKTISVRLGQMWKNMTKSAKETYYQRSKQAGQDHKLKYPGYIYNPKEARIRKALREQSRVRNPSVAPPRWNKRLLMIVSCCRVYIQPQGGYIYNPKEARIRKALREQSRVRNPSVAPPRWNKRYIYNPKEARIRKALREQSRVRNPSVAPTRWNKRYIYNPKEARIRKALREQSRVRNPSVAPPRWNKRLLMIVSCCRVYLQPQGGQAGYARRCENRVESAIPASHLHDGTSVWYIYNPKEARIRKALREQSRVRNPSVAPPRWNKRLLIMNRQSFVSPVLLPQQSHVTEDSKAMLHEQVDREHQHTMLQSYPDYVDLPYNVPSTDYSLDNHNWYPATYTQPASQSDGDYMSRTPDSKLNIDWSTRYNSEQGNFIRASPQSSPYTIQNPTEVNSLMLNGDSNHQEQMTTQCDANCMLDHKPVMDPIISQNGTSTGLIKVGAGHH
ncbi:uncharacterized protein LOC128985068 [Macrosteles quadrilineatus]|uniref:uncharacterized protein LOC128985068 n=1 Tax=Macrosteles quadrilineatus TaxID=74068 RepID=UPI0023E22627|nr:uncharacterized protein LOC128985068 [Macrosteles quadrilineatus]